MHGRTSLTLLLALCTATAADAQSMGSGYRAPAQVAEELAALVAASPARARVPQFPPLAAAGLSAIELAAPGEVEPGARPTLLILGGLDGVSLAGSEAALACARALASDASPLGSDVSVVVVPCASPQALERYLALGRGEGGDATPVDRDRDGRSDEDGPDDVDGDGLVLSMLLEDPAGRWVLSDDERFLVEARAGDAPRLSLVPEGRDDDRDGAFNEDGPGGVVLERNFPLERPAADPLAGPLPLSQPAARALADFVLARRVFAVVLLQGSHGWLASPGGSESIERWAEPDRGLYELCVRELRSATARPQADVLALRAARHGAVGGLAQDWFAVVGGALSLELAPWGPCVAEPTRAAALDARFRVTEGVGEGARPPLERDRRWTSYLDNVTGGSAFVAWTPHVVDGVRVRIGGWKPWTIENPPAAELPRALAGIERFVLALAKGAPKLELEASATRDGGIATLRARVRNAGRLPTSLAASSAVGAAASVTLELLLEEDQQLLAGREADSLPRLVGGEASAEREWVVLAPADKPLRLRVSAPWCNPLEREVRP
jgi:hypothetical protein